MELKPTRDYLRDTIGLDPETMGLPMVNSIIQKHMNRCGSRTCAEHLSLLRSSKEKLKELIELAVVNETWFMRQPESFRYVKENLCSDKTQKLRTLSLGCATGEEPYSLAMTLLDAGLTAGQFTIDALDISEKSLNIAKTGRYKDTSFSKTIDSSFRNIHFTLSNGLYEIKPAIRKCVHFIHGNVLDLASALTGPSYDIIFCRHVFIYLCHDARKTLLNQIASLLSPTGTIFIGASESSLFRNTGYKSIKAPSTFGFVKAQSETDDAVAPDRPSDGLTKHHAGPREATKAAPPGMPVKDSKETDATCKHCWDLTGLLGDRSCEKLADYTHCNNCPVRIDYGRHFFNREAPDHYLNTWQASLSQRESETNLSNSQQVVIFRLGTELFALPSRLVLDIAGLSDIHTIPFKTNEVLLGIANFSGDLRLCVSVHELLTDQDHDLSGTHADSHDRRIYKRMMTAGKHNQTWSFLVDEIVDIKHIYNAEIDPDIPSDMKASSYSLGTTSYHDHIVIMLDPQLLFDNLERAAK
ncbi:MAG: chemotaxis protein CheW [Phycisphaerae bacterium]|nr:chemotaxis protein CheW [Phycisphaerae bacterium]